MPNMNKRLITAREAAEVLGVTQGRIRQLRGDGTFETVWEYGKPLVKRAEVERYKRNRDKALEQF